MLVKLGLLCSLIFVATATVQYHGHKVYRLNVVDENRAYIENLLEKDDAGMDWWKEPLRNGPSTADVRIVPALQAQFEAELTANKVQWSVMIQDVELVAAKQKMESLMRSNRTVGEDWFTAYHEYEDTLEWAKHLVDLYPKLAQVESIGRSYEGRDIVAIHIRGKASNRPKPGIFFDGGIHAREWISPAVVEFIAVQLLEGYGSSSEITYLVDNIDWTIVPIFNVDGYAYTWSNDRMWRKTRMPNQGSTCVGTDPCRNAEVGWGGEGASSNPCSETYMGKEAMDQPEVQAIANHIRKVGNVKGYINYHSYSQLFLSPWGWTSQFPKDYEMQTDLGKKAVAAIKATHGKEYTEGPAYTTIYPASGIMCDWAYEAANVTLSYTIELRDTGAWGFLLPPEQIIPTGEENWEGAKVMAHYILDNADKL